MNRSGSFTLAPLLEALARGTAMFDLTGPLTVLAEHRRQQRQQAAAEERR